MPEIHYYVKDAVINDMRKIEDLSATVDMWSDRRKRSFMATCVCYINENFEYVTLLLDARYVKSPHTGATIFDEFQKVRGTL